MTFQPAFRGRRLENEDCRGATIVETIVAMAIVVLFLSGVHLMNSQVWRLLNSSLESISGTRTLNGRAEQLRSATWDQITDPSYLRDSILAVAPNSGGRIGAATESIEVTAYLAPAGTVAPIKVNRDAAGSASITATGDGTMSEQPSVQIDNAVTWTAKGGQSHTRQFRMIFTKGGISGRK